MRSLKSLATDAIRFHSLPSSRTARRVLCFDVNRIAGKWEGKNRGWEGLSNKRLV